MITTGTHFEKEQRSCMIYVLEEFCCQVSTLVCVEPSDVLPYDLREEHVAQSVHLPLARHLPTPGL